MKQIRIICTAIIALLLISSCGHRTNDGRMVEKFISRLNAREYACASQYVYPGDHPKLNLFTEVLSKNPETFFKLISKENVTVDGNPAVRIRLECLNTTPYFRNYMEALGVINESGIIEDVWQIRETVDGNSLSFNWANITGENLMLAKLDEGQQIPVYRAQSRNSTEIGTLEAGEKVIINDYPADSKWVKCFTIDDNCRLINGYIDRESITTTDGKFFSIGIFDTFSLLIAGILFVVFGALFFLIKLVVQALMNTGCLAWIVIPILIIAWLYILYQLLEKILFELFIINLPY